MPVALMSARVMSFFTSALKHTAIEAPGWGQSFSTLPYQLVLTFSRGRDS